jgi:phosphoribosylformylglycinamidine cyclo-ligase
MTPEVYKQEHGNKISKIFYEAIQQSWRTAVVEYGGGFRSVRTRPAPEGYVEYGMNSDGIGTKVEVAELMNYFMYLGHDLVAMVCDDASAMGAVPFMMSTTLDFGTMDEEIPYDKIETLAKGLVQGAAIANVPVMAGESGQMGTRINGRGKLPILWNASLAWWADPKKLVTGEKMKSGDYIVGIEEPYCRSNGYTLIRKIAEACSGPQWVHKKCPGADTTFGAAAIHPSKIYTPYIQYLLSTEAKIHGMIHVTGGGLKGRIVDYLSPFGLGAVIDNAYPAGELFRSLVEGGLVSIRAAYETWCMGNGFLIITPEPVYVQEVLMEADCPSQVVGQVTDSGKVKISSNLSLEW